MEDYDVFNELHTDKIIICGIDYNNEELMDKYFLQDDNFEFMPIRLSYDLKPFSDEYINKTKQLFIYYYNFDNTFVNETLKLKKHFIHYQRKPVAVFIPKNSKYEQIEKMFIEVGIPVLKTEADIILFNNNIIQSKGKDYEVSNCDR